MNYKYISYKDLTPAHHEKIENYEYDHYLVIDDENKANVFTPIELTKRNIMLGSLTIDNACVDTQSLSVGAVYMGQLSVEIESEINRYTLLNKRLTAYLEFHAEDGSTEIERVKLGIYYIAEANRTGKFIAIKAYDGMIKLEKTLTFNSTQGKPYNILKNVADQTGIELSQTEEEIDALSPKTEQGAFVPLVLKADSGIKVYRTLVSYIAETLGGFATFDFDGRLKISRFQKLEDIENIKVITASDRKGATFADFTIQYAGITAKIKGVEITRTTGEIEGQILNIGENPLIQNGVDETISNYLDNIANAISGVKYNPFDCEYFGNPFIELGQLILFTGEPADADGSYGLVTSSNWKSAGMQKLQAVGENPYLSNVKTTDEKIKETVTDNIANKVIRHIIYENTSEHQINTGETKKKIIELTGTFGDEGASALFSANIVLNVETAGTFKFTYLLNNEELVFKPMQLMSAGYYTMSLNYGIITGAANSETNFEVYIETADGQATINTNNIHAYMSGSSLSTGADIWNGRINIDEMYNFIEITNFSPSVFADGGAIVTFEDTGLQPSEPKEPIYIETKIVIIPKMTSNPFTDGNGTWTAAGSSLYRNGAEATTFNYHYPYAEIANKFWAPNAANSPPQYIEIQMPYARPLASYELRTDTRADATAANTITAWEIKGSNDGEKWDVLDVQTNQAIGDGALHSYKLPEKSAEYSRYRLYITAGIGWMIISKFQLYEKEERIYIYEY